MNVSSFSFLLHKPEKIASGHTSELEKIIEEFPYFQPARALQLKGLKQEKSFKYNDTLKVVAAHTRDRSILFEFITSKEFTQNRVANKIMELASGMEVSELEVEDQEEVIVKDNKTTFDFNKVDAESVMDPELFQPKTPGKSPSSASPEMQETVKKQEKGSITAAPEAPLNLGAPLEFDRSETHSFTEWLKLSDRLKPIDRETTKTTAPIPDTESANSESEEAAPAAEEKTASKEESAGLGNKLSLIDRFLENNPKIPPVSKDAPAMNLVTDYEAPSHALMTETLARVYLEQKKYKKAIQAYKILSLKYPEKSGLFADQIKAIKKLKDGNK
ncbi:hypothetical protein [Robertkochia flava]|uniref:hypothetical protein n=1 Tax=Robertkochia flava TaxID=3447986 RepID=UPI001CCAFFF8|nr:hypothetical protein [Robertkochia marina]